MDTRAGGRTPDTGQDTLEPRLTALQAAARLGVHERTIRRAIARGELAASKEAGLFRISVSALDQFRSRRLDAVAATDKHPARAARSPIHAAATAPTLVVVSPEPHDRTPLPAPLDTLVGRTREIAELRDLLRQPEARLLTLTGPGGVGKTRLALTVAASLVEDFTDGVAFVPLSSIGDPALVLPTIARSLGVWDTGDRPIAAGLASALRQRELLLVVDNFEQVIAGSPALADLLAASPGVTLLVTSREPLRVSGEYRYPVLPLPIPTATGPIAAPEIEEFAGVALFVERARRVRPGFALSAENAATVAAICARLDGLPLAIEMATAWLGTLSPDALLQRLEHRLPLLTGGNRDLPDRQRTMRDAVAWSYGLLSEAEQRCFRQLSVFVGGFTLDAAEYLRNAGETAGVVLLIDALVAKNLLVAQEGPATGNHAVPRFGMLETVREFALECLATDEDSQLIHERHANWCLEFGEEAWRQLWQQPLKLANLDRVEAEHDNLRAALGWLNETEDGERALRLAVSLTPFWYFRGHRREGLAWSRRAHALAAAQPIPTLVAAETAHCLGLLAESAEAAIAAQTESARLYRAAGDRWGIAAALQSLAFVLVSEGRLDEATTAGEEALAIFESLGLPERISDLHGLLGRIAYARGELDRSHALLTAALDLGRECGDWFSIGQALNALALVSVDRGQIASASVHFRDGLATWLRMGSKDGIANCLAGVATLATVMREWDAAARLFGAVAAMQVLVGHESRTERGRHLRAEREAATRLGAAFTAAFETGQTWQPEAAIAAAVAFLDAATTDAPQLRDSAATAYRLTQREFDVLQLLAQGRSDREIADTLFVGLRTVESHVRAIRDKLGVDSRTAAATLAVREGLV